MTRQRGILVLIVLLMVLVSMFWVLQKYPLLAEPHINLEITPREPLPITIHHKKSQKNHEFTGELPVRLCDSFSTEIQNKNSEQTEVTLAFVVTRPASCSGDVAPAPFTVMFSSSEGEVPKLAQVLMNHEPVRFVVVEDR